MSNDDLTMSRLLERMERLEAELNEAKQGGGAAAALETEKWLESMRRESRFQGLGKPVDNPNAHRGLKYPGMRFHLDHIEPVYVKNSEDEKHKCKGPGWFDTMAEFLKAQEARRNIPPQYDPPLAQVFEQPIATDVVLPPHQTVTVGNKKKPGPKPKAEKVGA